MSDDVENIESKDIRILWNSGDELPFIYANQMLVTHGTETEFQIVFGQLTPPLTFGLTKEELPDIVEIKPVAKIVVTPEVMYRFFDALKDNLETYEKKKGESNDS